MFSNKPDGAAAKSIITAESPLVLIVDDEKSICSTIAHVLEDDSYRTLIAHDGADAIRKAQEFGPEIVFLDIWMAGSDGLETLTKIKECSPYTEVIMISGHATIANALEATKQGAFDFIEKPLDIESIVFATKRALERRKILIGNAQKRQHRSGFEVISNHASDQPLLTHPGVLSKGLKGENIGQRTIVKSVVLYGQGLHSGQKSGLVLEPLPKNSGIHFTNIGKTNAIPAFIDYVDSTAFATTLRHSGASAGTIEHLMSALHAYRITNLLVKCNVEVPIFDGSAIRFCEAIEEACIEEQGGDWFEIAVEQPVELVVGDNEKISLEPSDHLHVSYKLDYPEPVGKQSFEFVFNNVDSFKQEIAPARTFGFMKDIERLQRAGLAAGGRLDNFVLIGSEKVINTSLRFPDELVRHKILDILGDLYLLGRPIRAKITAQMTGHTDNIALLRMLRDEVLESHN
jgi:UDP-3-O-acyl N-acetylglucosamine deacetylase